MLNVEGLFSFGFGFTEISGFEVTSAISVRLPWFLEASSYRQACSFSLSEKLRMLNVEGLFSFCFGFTKLSAFEATSTISLRPWLLEATLAFGIASSTILADYVVLGGSARVNVTSLFSSRFSSRLCTILFDNWL